MLRAMNRGFPIFFVLLLAALCMGRAGAQTVTNVRAAQRAGTKLVDVYYDLSGGSGPSTVAVAVSDNGGASYTVSASSLSGDVGGGVNAGLNKHVIWDAGADWDGQFSQAVKFQITATEPLPAPEGFALITAGSFQMGDTFNEGYSNEQPVHSVYVSAFYMGKFEVTKALWDGVRTWGLANGYTDLETGGGKAANHPVHTVSWFSIIKWCNARSEKEGLTPCYYNDDAKTAIYRAGEVDVTNTRVKWNANGYRLPTEAEWEKSARGGLSGRRFPWGNTISHSRANYYVYSSNGTTNDYSYDVSPTQGDHPGYNIDEYPYTSPAGSFAANGYGLHDMTGNVWEYCWDWYSGYPHEASDPRGSASGSGRVLRGGGWSGYRIEFGCRVAFRYNHAPHVVSDDFGFRVVRSSLTQPPGFTPNITVDTRGTGDVTVTGRVVDGIRKMLISGATLTVGGTTTISEENGTFVLNNVTLEGTGALHADAPDYAPQTRTVQTKADEKAVDVGDIPLFPSGDRPQIEWVKLDPEGCFLTGWDTTFQAKAKVNWNGFTPLTVTFFANTVAVHEVHGPGPEHEVVFSVDEHFKPSLQPQANQITVIATGFPQGTPEAPLSSQPMQCPVFVLPVPDPLKSYMSGSSNKTSDGVELILAIATPPDQRPFGSFNLPVLGTFGGETSWAGELRYNIKSRAWKVEVGGRFDGEATKYSAIRMRLGQTDFKTEIKGTAAGTATITEGIKLSTFEISSLLSLRGEYALGSYGPFTLLGPRLTQMVLDTPVLNEGFRAVSVLLLLKPGLDGKSTLQAYPKLGFKEFEFIGKAALEASYEPELGKIKAKIYVGGEPSVKFGLPGEFFRELGFRAYIGLEASVWTFTYEKEFVFVDFHHPARASALPIQPGPLIFERAHVLEASANAGGTWHPIKRAWREEGNEVFFTTDIKTSRAEENQRKQTGHYEFGDFLHMSRLNITDEVDVGVGVARMMIIPNYDNYPTHAEFPLLGNVFPNSEPALAGRDNELMLLYVRDTGATSAVQFTEVAFSYFDGTTWTVPAPIANDARGQFSPHVEFDGTGNAVAVFERIKDGAFSGINLQEMAAQMEIVSCRWDAVTKTWSLPQALTDNAFLDFNPQLSGPLTDGDLLLTWNQSESNEIDGTGAPGAGTNLRVMTRRWDSATHTWATEAVLVPNLTGELSESLAARGEKGVYAWSVDMDGNTDDSADAELFYRLYNATSGEWSPITRHTNDAVQDNHLHAVVDAAGNVYTVWNRNGDLVMDVNFNGTPTLVREGSEGPGVADFALTIGPGGNLALLWQEMTEHGSDAHYRVYDPASGTWGKDAFLSKDSDLERSFAPVWDAAGNLTLAYNNVQITKVTKQVVVEGGEVVEVEGVPQPGRVDLLLAKRRLVKDVTLVPEGLTADGTNFLPGDEVTLRARVRNAGNLAVQDLQMAFYDGDPDAGGVLIATEVIPGWLEAQDEAEVSHEWMVPQPVQARTIFVVVDPDNEVTEADESNNRLALPINGVDLALEYQSGSVLRDGSARVVVKVRNLSAPDSPVSTLKLKDLNSGVTLAETSVSQLAPGQSVDVPFDLPEGTQPEGDRAYVLVIDEEELVEDIDRKNNEAPFALNLWIDDDGDGIPRWWELANGTSDDNEGDALLDLDGDGFNALQEFLAGTDPADRNSRLALGGQNVVEHVNGDPGTHSISWPSAAGRLYRLERSYDLETWETVEETIEASPPLNQKLDTPGMTGKRVFYRVSVQ